MSKEAREGDQAGARMLRRLGAVSARRVAEGGETGLWRWLIPALALCLLVVVGQRVLQLDRISNRTDADAAVAQSLSTDVVERSALVTETWLARRVDPATLRAMTANRVAVQRHV